MKRNTIFWVLLSGVVLVFIGSFNPEYHLFPRCPFKLLTSFQCPGCGSQRAIHYALHGQFGQAFQMNWLFIPGVLYSFTGILLSAYSNRWSEIQPKWFGKRAAWVAFAVIIVFWIGRNLI